MPKRGIQYHDYYFEHYENIDKRGRKSEWEKDNTILFENHQFRTIIENLVSESAIVQKYPKYSLVDSDIVDMVSALFYTHFEMSKDLLQYDEIFTPDDFAENFIHAIFSEKDKSNRDFSEYFEKEDSCFNGIFTIKSLASSNVKELMSKMCKLLSGKKANEIYRTLDLGKPVFDEGSCSGNDYPYFLFKKYIKGNKDMIFYRKAYSGLIPYIMFINNQYTSTALKYMLYNPIPYVDTCNDNYYTKHIQDKTSERLSRWYNELFDSNNRCYMELSGENKILEQQLLDTYFGCSVIGYILKHCSCDAAADIIENVGFMGIFGLLPGTKKVIDVVIKEYEDDDVNIDYSLNPYEEGESEESLLFNDIMKLFEKLMNGYVRFLNIKGSYTKRKEYIKKKETDFETPQMSDDWKYIFEENRNGLQQKYELKTESDKNMFINTLISKYASGIPSSFRYLYFFEEEDFKNIDEFL